MCGVFFSLSSTSAPPNHETRTLLEARGPDSCQTHTVRKEIQRPDGLSLTYHLTFLSTVLSLRGDHVFRQPLIDPITQSVLCWNGEAWKIAGERISGNDTEHVFSLFLQAVTSSGDCDRRDTTHRLGNAFASISGPSAFVFYDAKNSRVFFSRDCLGRRSLLQGYEEDGSMKICSLCDGLSSAQFEEVGFDGVYMIDLEAPQDPDRYRIETLPWSSVSSPQEGHIVSCSIFCLDDRKN